MNIENRYELALERMEDEMRRAAVWRTQRAAIDARHKRARGGQSEQVKRGLIATLTQAFAAWGRDERSEAANAQVRNAEVSGNGVAAHQ